MLFYAIRGNAHVDLHIDFPQEVERALEKREELKQEFERVFPDATPEQKKDYEQIINEGNTIGIAFCPFKEH